MPQTVDDLHCFSTSPDGWDMDHMRVAAQDSDHMAYTFLEFEDYYGGYASAAWSEAIPAMTLDGRLWMVFLTLGDLKIWCHADRLRQTSDFFRAWFDRWHTTNRCCAITMLPNAVDDRTAGIILSYFRYNTPQMKHDKHSGVASLADYLGMVDFLTNFTV